MKLRILVPAFLLLVSCGSQENSRISSTEGIVEQPFWQIDKPGDNALRAGHVLSSYFVAAQEKKLPTNYFRDIIAARGNVRVRYGEWPSFQPSSGGGTISHPKVGQPFSEWRSLDWSSFYNELYHAWWASVFTRSANYAADRTALLTNERKVHYRRAHPSDPLLAQEEAYSETIATLMVYLYPRYNPQSASGVGYGELTDYPYNQNRTVSPVSHSDRPGYTPEAETTFPNPAEYAVIFRQLTDSVPPQQ
jgi:hypothetical protein